MLRSLWPALCLAASCFGAVAVFSLAPPSQGQVIAVFAPSAGQADILMSVQAAEGRIVEWRHDSNILVTWSDEADFPARLKANGAWLVLNPLGASGCTSRPRPHTPFQTL